MRASLFTLLIFIQLSLPRAFAEFYCGTSKSSIVTPSNGASINATGKYVNGVYIRWSSEDALDLRYCVSKSDFGTHYEKIVEVIRKASEDWMEVANVAFIHMEDQDENCDVKNQEVLFHVIGSEEDTNWSMKAFFPYASRKKRRVLINQKYYSYKSRTLEGLMRHELGHILGLRHEHIRDENPNQCDGPEENDLFKAITEYDVKSVMHYQKCGGMNPKRVISDLDIEGIQYLYPF